MSQPPLLLILFLFISCKERDNYTDNVVVDFAKQSLLFETIKDIPVPDGYERPALDPASFGQWLKVIRLKKDNHVYLFDGSLKKNQSAQFAVLDVSVGKKNLQQCADAVMRLRAEYLFDQGRYAEIDFRDNNNKSYAWHGKNNKQAFDNYLETVFGSCGTASLEKQLNAVTDWRQIEPGNVLIKGGYPSHAMIVADVAINKKGEKIFMLAQGYMPAQDIHIVNNPMNKIISPWYEVSNAEQIITPEWTFRPQQLRRF